MISNKNFLQTFFDSAGVVSPEIDKKGEFEDENVSFFERLEMVIIQRVTK